MKTVAVLAGLAAAANAHATWQYIWKNGEDLGSTCVRKVSSNSPIEDYTGTALQCNVNPAPAEGNCAFVAGDEVTIEMHQHDSRSATEEGIGGAHWGPVLAYMASVSDAAAATGAEGFFKVYQNAWAKAPGSTQGDNDYWGTKDMNYNGGKLSFTIPKDLAAGDYLLRAEAIALHAASASGGAQHYVACYQLTVSGSGALKPTDTVTFPDAYSKTGPGLGFSIHAPLDSYPVPGPALIEGGTEATPQLLTFGSIAGAPAATAAPATATKPASSVASATPAVSAAPASSSAAAQTSAAAPTSAVAPTSAAAAPTPIPESSAAPSSTAAAAPSATPSAPAAEKEYTLEEFIAFLEEADAADSSAAPQKVRRHPRAFRLL
ncbi:hypothetical protein BU23DRAFT_507287 [Bimuria novae-zelandiae CBS 107.79]|uniref:AA9 family lytic polysaccharide monooxygenase n=1 Tax=Bimuria novae-zelandiae CBS 107.79 TaxID=1447943 RepID=A0A6A5V8S4_9PLEO|nr:hypothetical protein BU23DRAFT_507287 [Bimuria novae-zelandiae CBS 107.79]